MVLYAFYCLEYKLSFVRIEFINKAIQSVFHFESDATTQTGSPFRNFSMLYMKITEEADLG